ncbi:MAG: hypothetical protein LCH96_03735 [Actinobacteria bacterium]|nr:hypothetical protein [Actinomycetota bacterium]
MLNERQSQSYGGLVFFQVVIIVMAITPLFWGGAAFWRLLYWMGVALLEFLLVRAFLKRRHMDAPRNKAD